MIDRVCQAACPLPEDGSYSPADLPKAISDLAGRGVSPDTFHFEERGLRLATLTGGCSAVQISLFRNLQTDLSARIGEMSTQQIADNLRRLYDRTYRYDALSRTMGVTDPQAKRQLDLWIAVIDHRAFQDEAFLNRILERRVEIACLAGESSESSESGRSQASREIEIVMALNSPNLSSRDRGTFHRIKNRLMTWEEAARERDDLTEEWLHSYDGRTPLYETPLVRSAAEFRIAAVAWLGREAVRQIAQETYSETRLRSMAKRLGLSHEFTTLSAMPDEALRERIQDLIELSVEPPPPDLARTVAREAKIVASILAGRGIGDDGRDDPSMTASRLDDYQRRNELLAKFRDAYREFLVTPLAERFSPERSQSYIEWTWLLTAARMQGVPVTVEEIEGARREVQREVGVQTSGQLTWRQFVKWNTPVPPFQWDTRVPLFVRPDELGGTLLASGSCAEPFAISSRMIIDGRPLSELVRENVDFVAVLPWAPPGVVGAYLFFGVVVLNGGNWSAARRLVPSPGYFHEILAHEVVGHQFFGRASFNEHPYLNFRKALRELYSYNVTQLTQDAYRDTGCALPSEQLFLQGSAAQIDYLIRMTNRRLGLGPEERGLRLTDPRWGGRIPEFFDFQPHGYVDGLSNPFSK